MNKDCELTSTAARTSVTHGIDVAGRRRSVPVRSPVRVPASLLGSVRRQVRATPRRPDRLVHVGHAARRPAPRGRPGAGGGSRRRRHGIVRSRARRRARRAGVHGYLVVAERPSRHVRVRVEGAHVGQRGVAAVAAGIHVVVYPGIGDGWGRRRGAVTGPATGPGG
ncbi:hypothetical protein DFJ74DRAFT_319998 [Hyaloraphidium curvatum]|nr:hypothetical protein DFJ74DRAFT_319998 [Hyaloraphidium curvatum]